MGAKRTTSLVYDTLLVCIQLSKKHQKRLNRLDPIFCVATNISPEKVYEWLKITNFARCLFLLKMQKNLTRKIREIRFTKKNVCLKTAKINTRKRTQALQTWIGERRRGLKVVLSLP